MTASKPPDEGTPRTDVVCRSIESDGMLLNRGTITLQLAHDFAVESQRRMTMHARQLERELQAAESRAASANACIRDARSWGCTVEVWGGAQRVITLPNAWVEKHAAAIDAALSAGGSDDKG